MKAMQGSSTACTAMQDQQPALGTQAAAGMRRSMHRTLLILALTI